MTQLLLSARDIYATRLVEGGRVDVLAGVSLDVAHGEVVELSGPSGAGKTTLLLALARLLPGVTGSLSLDGEPAEAIAPQVWRSRVALLPQRATLVAGTVRENILLPYTLKARADCTPPGDAAQRAALDAVGLDAVALDRDASRLSVGQAARVALLRVVLTSPQQLLLDEPDASLDDVSAEQVAAMTARFAADGGAVLRVSHVRANDKADACYRLAAGHLERVSL